MISESSSSHSRHSIIIPFRRPFGTADSEVKVTFTHPSKNGKTGDTLSQAFYQYLQCIVEHRPMFWYLQRTQAYANPNMSTVIRALAQVFPLWKDICRGCGAKFTAYHDHLATIYYLSRLGGHQLRNIRLDGLNWRYEYYCSKNACWKTITGEHKLSEIVEKLPSH